MLIIRGTDKWQKIKVGKRGKYVRYRNTHLYLDEFTVPGSFTFEAKPDGKTEIHGAYSNTYYSGYLLHLSENGEEAKVYYAFW